MNNVKLFMLLDSIDDKYIADAEIKPKATAISDREHGFWGFFNNAATIVATVVILCAIIVWTLVGKDILNGLKGDTSTDENPQETTTPSEPIKLEPPSGAGLSEITPTDITIEIYERNSSQSFDLVSENIYENVSTREATEMPKDKCYYTVTFQHETGGGDYYYIKKIYDPDDIEKIAQMLSDVEFEPTSDTVYFGVFIDRFSNENKTESYELDMENGYLYRKSALGGYEKSTLPLSDDDKCSIALAFFLSPNFEATAYHGGSETDNYASIFGFSNLFRETSFEVTLEYAGYKLTLDNDASYSFYNELLGGDNSKIRRAVQYGPRELFAENCIKYTCKKTTAKDVEEIVLYIDANNTVICTPAKRSDGLIVNGKTIITATASDDIYVTYEAFSFEFEDILSFMEQKLNEQNQDHFSGQPSLVTSRAKDKLIKTKSVNAGFVFGVLRKIFPYLLTNEWHLCILKVVNDFGDYL